MHILAVDTARFPGSVALLDGERCLVEQPLADTGNTAQTLFVTIEQLLAQQSWQPAAVQLLAVTIGPGSFTGLRIGVTLAKTWAYARGCPVVGLETTDVLAAQVELEAKRLSVVMNAERRQLFVANYERASSDPAGSLGRWTKSGATQIADRAAWLQQLEPGTLVTGDGLAAVAEQLPEEIIVADRSCWAVQASVLGRCAWRAYQSGKTSDPWKLVPEYYRASAAEEKRRT